MSATIKYCLWMLPLLAGGTLVFNRSFVSLWVGPEYSGGNLVSATVVASSMVGVAASILGGFTFSAGNITGNSAIAAAQAVLYVALLTVGARFFGLPGVAAASAISIMLTQGWYLPRALVQSFELDSTHLRSLLKNFAVAALAGAFTSAMFWFVVPSGWGGFALSAAGLTVVYVGLLFCMSADLRDEIRRYGGALFRNR